MDRCEYFTAQELFRGAAPLEDFGYPELLELEPIHSCNFRCTMCHVSYAPMSHRCVDVDVLRRRVEEAPWLRGKWAIVGAAFEPAVHPRFDEIIGIFTSAGMKIDLTTNGSLFTDKLIDRIKGGSFASVTVSFDGATKDTYERIRRRANFERTIDRVAAFREAVGNERTYYTANYTMLKSNLSEIVPAVELWDDMGFDHLAFISMVLRNEAVNDERLDDDRDLVRSELFSAADRVLAERRRLTLSSSYYHGTGYVSGDSIVASRHPDAIKPINCRPYFQEGAHPDVPVGCRSPYKHMRIGFDGEVLLCNKHNVGDISTASLADIWRSPAAADIRRTIKSGPAMCHACDFYKFCIKASTIDVDDSRNWINETLRHERGVRNVEV